MTRWKASGIHLLISAGIAAAAVAVMLGVMYPWEYFQASGGFKLLAILLSVDVVIGPLLTLLVFKIGKPSLKFDLTVIALLQVAALVYGMWVVIEARPVFLVHVGDRFHLVRANDLEDELLALGSEERFRTKSWTGPRLAVAIKPRDVDRQQELMMAALSGTDLNYFPETYSDYEQHTDAVLARSLSTVQLLKNRPEDGAPIAAFLEDNSREASSTVVLPLKVGINFLTALVDSRTGEILKIFAVDPWGE
ncbi:MAG: TfpX/TfpZ family type IV pilin accessory protein [Pseudomonadota bacterium]